MGFDRSLVLGWVLLAGGQAFAGQPVTSEESLRQALRDAAGASSPVSVVLAEGVHIPVHQPLVYAGSQPLTIEGNGALLDGAYAGTFTMNADGSAVTEDATFVFRTAASVTLRNLAVVNSATRGIVVTVPETATGEARVSLEHVTVDRAALYGLHVDDNADAFDDGQKGSAAGIHLVLEDVLIRGAGTGALDFDGVRVDERGEGGIRAEFRRVRVENNGGDGIELDEAGPGDVQVSGQHVVLNDNGFYNDADLDDGFDIDEADEGNLIVELSDTGLNGNQDEGLDFDEAGDGDARVMITSLQARRTRGEAIKLDESGAGDLEVQLRQIRVEEGGDDGIQLTEQGPGQIQGELTDVKADRNRKFGIRIGQWLVEDETVTSEPSGSLRLRNVQLHGNGKGDEISTHQVRLN